MKILELFQIIFCTSFFTVFLHQAQHRSTQHRHGTSSTTPLHTTQARYIKHNTAPHNTDTVHVRHLQAAPVQTWRLQWRPPVEQKYMSIRGAESEYAIEGISPRLPAVIILVIFIVFVKMSN